MILHPTHFAIGIVYLVFFACKARKCRPCRWLKRLRLLPAEDYCELVLGCLYSLSGITG